MNTGLRLGTMGVLTAGLLAGQVVLADGHKQGNGGRKRGDDAGECGAKNVRAKKHAEARKQHRQTMRERMKKNREARKQLMEAVAAEDDAHKALAMVRSHCVSQHEERSAFHQKMMEERLAKITERLENGKMEQSKREDILARITGSMEKRKTKAEAHYSELLASLDALKAKEDLVKKDILKALRAAAPKRMRKRGKNHDGQMRRKRDKNGDGTLRRKRKTKEN